MARRSLHTMAMIASFWYVTPAGCAEFSGVPVTSDVLPAEVIKPIPVEITTDQFKARLKQGGTLTLDGNTLTLSPSSEQKRPIAFMALDKLELKNGAKIITNGNALEIFANEISSENGGIVSFEGAALKARKGAPASNSVGANGNSGDPGLSGGLVSLHIIQKLDGVLNIDLKGQEGGDGSDGRQGGQPPKAGRGEDAQDGPGGWLTPGWCKSGGSDGEPGTTGLTGGAAGQGGPGGDGGILEVINVGAAPIPNAAYTFSAKAGGAGSSGKPGPGGPGGLGGDGGHGSTWCGGGHGGPSGPPGSAGPIPSPQSGGKDGNAIAKNLDLEVIIRTSVIVPPGAASTTSH